MVTKFIVLLTQLLSRMPILNRSSVLESCPQITLMDEVVETDTFFDATQELCQQHSYAIFVTHREGIRDVHDRVGQPLRGRIPYCAIVGATYNSPTNEWQLNPLIKA